MNLFQTSLYLFSSLLQADAAILGFGAIFIIFKIQSLETIRQNIIQTYYSKGIGYLGIINSLLNDQPSLIANTLSKQKDLNDFRNMKYIVCIPAKNKEIGKSIQPPITIIATHAIFCGIMLYLSQYIFEFPYIQDCIILFSLIWFALGIILATRLSITLLTKSDNYPISILRPDVFEFVTDKTEAKWHDN